MIEYLGRNVTKIDLQEPFKQILLSVIKTILDFFEVHWKMIFRDTPVVIQDMFGVTPKSFDPIDMVLHAVSAHKAF